jgi:protein-S-isoprenylcysteine O-methyltransferase Ste14
MVGAAYLVERTYRNPNPTPARRNSDDALRFVVPFAALITHTVLVLPALINAAFALTHPSPPLGICLRPDLVNPAYTTWTLWTAACLAAVYASGALRLLAYRALGSSFSFELAPPPRLVTTGVYAYAQHPSYVPAAVATVACAALSHNFDGWAACYVPAGVLARVAGVMGRNPSILALSLIWTVVMVVRIREEDAMLRRTFGEEWEVWHRKTARIIPGVF